MSAQRDKNDRCASYTAERLYAAYPGGEGGRAYNVAVVPANAKAGIAPLCTISYNMSGLGGLAVDQIGKLWASLSEQPALIAFAHGQNGGDPPAQIIAGSKTLLVSLPGSGAQGISVDSYGNVWYPCWYGYNGPNGYLVAFKNDAHGNVAPIMTIGYGDKGVSEETGAPYGTVFDREGNLYVSEFSVPGKIVVFSPPFKDTSRPVAVWTVPAAADYMAVDHSDNIYVGGDQGYYYVFEHGLRSNGIIARTVDLPFGAYDVKAASNGRVYVGLIGPDPSGDSAVGVLPPKATSWDQVRYLTSPSFIGAPGPLALGL